MIVGHGIDLQDMEAIAKLLAKKPAIISKILRPKELLVFESLSEARRLTYLSGRWSAKEAFAKAYGTGIVKGCGFQDLEILADERGRPIFTKHPFAGKVHVSISHSGAFAQASVILEGEEHGQQSASSNLGDG